MKNVFIETIHELFDEFHSNLPHKYIDPTFVNFEDSKYAKEDKYRRPKTTDDGELRFYFRIFHKFVFGSHRNEFVSSIKHIITNYDFNNPNQLRFLFGMMGSIPESIANDIIDHFKLTFISKKNPSLWKFYHVNEEHWHHAGACATSIISHMMLGLVDGRERRDWFFLLIENTYACKKKKPIFKLTAEQKKLSEENYWKASSEIAEDKKRKREARRRTADQNIAGFIAGLFNYSDDYYLNFFQKFFSKEDKEVIAKYLGIHLLGEHFPDELLKSAIKISPGTKKVVEDGMIAHVQKNASRIKIYSRELISAMKLSARVYDVVAEAFMITAKSIDWNKESKYDTDRLADYTKALTEDDVHKFVGIVFRSLGSLEKLEALSKSNARLIPDWSVLRYTALR